MEEAGKGKPRTENPSQAMMQTTNFSSISNVYFLSFTVYKYLS